MHARRSVAHAPDQSLMPSAGGRQQTIAIVRQLIPTPGNMLVGADQGKVSFIQVSCLRGINR